MNHQRSRTQTKATNKTATPATTRPLVPDLCPRRERECTIRPTMRHPIRGRNGPHNDYVYTATMYEIDNVCYLTMEYPVHKSLLRCDGVVNGYKLLGLEYTVHVSCRVLDAGSNQYQYCKRLPHFSPPPRPTSSHPTSVITRHARITQNKAFKIFVSKSRCYNIEHR